MCICMCVYTHTLFVCLFVYVAKIRITFLSCNLNTRGLKEKGPRLVRGVKVIDFSVS